jgi:hypothetical protein
MRIKIADKRLRARADAPRERSIDADLSPVARFDTPADIRAMKLRSFSPHTKKPPKPARERKRIVILARPTPVRRPTLEEFASALALLNSNENAVRAHNLKVGKVR